MSSQDSKAFENMDFNFGSYKDILIVLKEEHTLLEKLQYMEHLVMNYLSTVPEINIDSEILCFLMPQAKEILEKVYEKTVDLVYESNDEEICSHTLQTIQEYLQMAISLFETLKVALNFIISKKKMNYSHVKSLPINIGQMLYATFLHCKESNNIYKIYFDSLAEILLIFKTAQEVHSKLLIVLEDCLVYNILCDDEMISLNNVLDNLTEVGDVLTGMNVKSMADNWKSYMNLAQKYNKELKKYINIERPLLYFTSELVKSLNSVVDMNFDDNQNITHTLKIANFMLRIMMKSCDTFWDKTSVHIDILWNFLTDFYGIYSPALQNKRFSENTVTLLQTSIGNGLEQFLNKLVHVKEFYDVQLLESLITNTDSSLGFILVSNIVLQQLTADENYDCSTTFSQYLDCIFMAINKCYILFMKEEKLYEELICSIVSLTSRLNNEQFSNIELILFKNVLSPSVWNSIFAYDTWRMICRTCNIQYQFDTLCWLIEHFQDCLKAQYTSRPQFVILGNLVGELYQMLNHNYKLEFIKKYPLSRSSYIWKHIGLTDFPISSQTQVSSMLTCLSETMEKFDLSKSTYDEFLTMVDAMNIFGTVNFEEIYFDLKKINMVLMNLWDFDGTDTNLLNSKIFGLYLDNLCKLTVNLTWRLSNTQLIQVMHQMKVLLENDVSSKHAILLMINTTLRRSTDYSQEQQTIFQIISELFILLLTNGNSIIRICTLEVVQEALNNLVWKEVLHNRLVNKNDHVQKLISTFSNKITRKNINTFKAYMALEQSKFQHVCLEDLPLGPILKKKKIEMYLETPVIKETVSQSNRNNPEASRVIQRIKKDVQYLGNLAGRDDLTQQNVKDINFILKELQHYV